MSFGYILHQKTLRLFDFLIFWLWLRLMKIIPEAHREHYIGYLRFYFNWFSLNNWTIYYCTYIWINNSFVEKKSTWINAEKGRFRTPITTTLFHFLRIEILFLFGIWLFISLFHPSDYFQKIHVVLTLAVIMESVS